MEDSKSSTGEDNAAYFASASRARRVAPRKLSPDREASISPFPTSVSGHRAASPTSTITRSRAKTPKPVPILSARASHIKPEQRHRLEKMMTEARTITKYVTSFPSPIHFTRKQVDGQKHRDISVSQETAGQHRHQTLDAEDEFAIRALNESTGRSSPTVQPTPSRRSRTSPSSSENSEELQRYIVDLKREHRKQLDMLNQENTRLQQKLESNKMYMARQEFNEKRYASGLKIKWEAAEATHRQAFKESMLLELQEKEKQIVKLYENKLNHGVRVAKASMAQQHEQELQARKKRENNVVANALRNQKQQLTKAYNEILGTVRSETQTIIAFSKQQQCSLTILSEWKNDTMKKMKEVSNVFLALQRTVAILKQQHPANVQILESRYESQLNDLSDELAKKTQQYTEVRQEVDESYYFRKKLEREVGAAKKKWAREKVEEQFRAFGVEQQHGFNVPRTDDSAGAVVSRFGVQDGDSTRAIEDQSNGRRSPLVKEL